MTHNVQHFFLNSGVARRKIRVVDCFEDDIDRAIDVDVRVAPCFDDEWDSVLYNGDGGYEIRLLARSADTEYR